MPRILFISTLTGVGGHEDLWFNTARLALEKGYEVGICVFDTPFAHNKLKEFQRYPNLHLFYKKQNGFLKQIYNRFIKTDFKFVEINRKAIKWQPDITLFTSGTNLPWGLDTALFAKKNLKYAIIGHGGNDLVWPDEVGTAYLKNNFCKSAANYFVSQANLNLAKLEVCDNIRNAKIVRNPYKVPYDNNLDYPDTKVIKMACVGTYNFEEKGQDVLLEVMNMPKWRERNIEINLYGKGIHEDKLHKLIKMFDLKNVFVRGYCPTLDIWKENHALLMPSRHEGLPMSIVEAMLCGRVPIVTDVSGNGEVIENNRSGFLAAAPRAVYLDEAMERAWQRREEWESIGKEATRYIKTLIPENPVEIFLDDLLSVVK